LGLGSRRTFVEVVLAGVGVPAVVAASWVWPQRGGFVVVDKSLESRVGEGTSKWSVRGERETRGTKQTTFWFYFGNMKKKKGARPTYIMFLAVIVVDWVIVTGTV
jgi:hypothetical protein